jgi:hypothetical protein
MAAPPRNEPTELPRLRSGSGVRHCSQRSAHRRSRWGSRIRGPARESGSSSQRGDETQAGSDVEDDDPLGGRADRLGDRAVIRVVEIGVTRLRRGEGDDGAVVVAVLNPSGLVEFPSTTASTPGIVPTKPRTDGRTSSSAWICFPLSRTPGRHG